MPQHRLSGRLTAARAPLSGRDQGLAAKIIQDQTAEIAQMHTLLTQV
ncbi:MAG: hypothetical protein JWP40_3761 [Blastococcus sp.]|jgi:uncharacterized protein (DUF305 family)|nr:hypothetical protein [Blastococcus sp.]